MTQPPPDLRTSPVWPPNELREIAWRQKGIIVCILIYLLAVVSQFFVPEGLRLLLGLALVPVIILATIFVFLLATKLYGTGAGVLLGLLTLIPRVGLIVLLIVNGRATSTLRTHGIQVGLLGAKGPY